MKNAIKKTLSILLVTVVFVSSAPLAGFVGLELPDWLDFSKLFAVEAEATTSGTCGENLTWTLDTSTGELVISGTGAMNNYSSSSSTRAPWYSNRSYIKTVKIGNGVTSIGNCAFFGFDSLTSITIPDSITSIGYMAFYKCTSLTSITIPDSVTSMGNYAFAYCDSLTSVTIPDSVTSIGDWAFYWCTNLTSITIGNSVTSIGYDAFYRCTSLTSITIPDGVTSIGDYAFYYCNSLTSITIGNSVKSIGDYAFYYCNSLTSITIGNSVKSIGDYAFYRCLNLTSITIPDSVTSIGISAFYECYSLTSITIPDSVTSIGDYAFAYCRNLTSATIPADIILGKSVFYQTGIKEPETKTTKISLINSSYNCIEGEKFYISGDIESENNVGDVTLTWTSGDGVKLYTPASVINSSANSASFSIEAEGIKEGTYTVTVSGGGASDSCTVSVVKLESKLAVTVEPVGGEYYLIDGTFYDSKLNEISSLQYKVTVKNVRTKLYLGTITDEIKEKLKIENVSVEAGLSDYTNLLIDIADITELKNIGTLAYDQSKSVIVDVTPTGKEIPKNVTLNVTATAEGKAAVSESAAISVKNKLYNPYATLNVTVTPQSIDYKDKKYSADKIDFIVTVTNVIPAQFSGKASKIKQWTDYDITLSEIEITPDDSKLLKKSGVKTEKVNKVLRASESYTFTGSYSVNSWHKMDKETESETVGFAFNASTSSNSKSIDKSVTFINGDYDKKIEYQKKSLRELLKEMQAEVLKCDVLTPTERILVNNIITAQITAMDMSAFKGALDAVEIVYEMACYVNDIMVDGYEKAGEVLIDRIKKEADKSEDKIEEALNTCLEDLRNSEEFNKFTQWYANQQTVKESKSKKGEVRCPVDVYVYDKNGNEVMAIVNNEVVKAINGVHAFVCGDDKTFYLPTDADYEIKIIATGNGTMDYIITEYNDDNKLRKTVYEDIPLTVNETYNGTVTKHTMPETESYNLTTSDGTEITHDKIELVESNITVQADIRTPSTTTIKYGDGIVLHADLSEALPAGWSIKWSASNSNFYYTVSVDGTTCTITPSKSGDTVFTATVYDAEGNEICKDEQTMTSKAGFFQKLAAFFKKLFGLTKIYPQEIKIEC